MKKLFHQICFLALVYTYGFFGGVLFHLLRILTIIDVRHYERFPQRKKKLILVSNHPSLFEPLLLPLLFLWGYIFYPNTFAPWSIPDYGNYFRNILYFWVKVRSIPVDRGNARGEMRALFKMKEILEEGGIIILFPEGGRTFKGKKFHFSKKGERIRELKKGIAWLVLNTTDVAVLPVWVKGTDDVLPNNKKIPLLRFWKKRITIKIGKVLTSEFFQGMQTKEEITKAIADSLLELADEE